MSSGHTFPAFGAARSMVSMSCHVCVCVGVCAEDPHELAAVRATEQSSPDSPAARTTPCFRLDQREGCGSRQHWKHTPVNNLKESNKRSGDRHVCLGTNHRQWAKGLLNKEVLDVALTLRQEARKGVVKLAAGVGVTDKIERSSGHRMQIQSCGYGYVECSDTVYRMTV
eukprot:5438539-Amphidinium_carterae.2